MSPRTGLGIEMGELGIELVEEVVVAIRRLVPNWFSLWCWGWFGTAAR